jgi:uncharacterized Zn finger protein
MWRPYVPVGDRQARAKKAMEKLRKKGEVIEPVEITGRKITEKFWGQKWCSHLEEMADFETRLDRGKSYVRNGSVCHLSVHQGGCKAFVSGSELYTVTVTIQPLSAHKWKNIKAKCSGQVGTMLELLQGKLNEHVMKIVTDPKEGLFPLSEEISFSCSCPDWAYMCKHIAAVLYGIGSRLDHQPELLFKLRGVDPTELATLAAVDLTLTGKAKETQIKHESLEDLFGIELDAIPSPEPKLKPKPKPKLKPKAKAPKKVKKRTKTPQKNKNIISGLTGSDLKLLRKKTGLSTAQFAKSLGFKQTDVEAWEEADELYRKD